MANAYDAFRRDKAFLAHDPVKERIEYYKKQPLAYEVPEHISRYTERKKLVLQTPFFRIPPWAGMPSFGGPHLEVVKDGVVATRWPLHRAPYTLIGKNAEVCDYVMEHPSTSGVHCAIVFHGERREFFIIDVSSNGTMLNGQRLVKAQPTPLPYDSTVRIALSTRSLVMRRNDMTTTQRQRLVEGKNAGLTVPNPIPSSSEGAATATPSVASASAPSSATVSAAADTPAATPAPAAVADAVGGSTPSPAVAVAAPTPTPSAPAPTVAEIKRHFRHLLVKHIDCADPVSKASRNKGEAVTRSPADATELASGLRAALIASSASSSVAEASFVQFCQQYSECKTSKKGGDLGMIAKGDMDANFDGPAFRLAPGAVSAPVVTDLGVHLIYRCAE